MTVAEKSLTDWLCGNHTRGLPVDAYNRLFETHLQDNLGAEFQEAAAASGGRARLEKNGVALLRSTCKLTHDGWGACAKGDGKDFRDFMDAHHPGKLDGLSITRAEVSKRQDWSLEASEAMFPLVEPILKYLVKTLCLDPNVLRDSTLQSTRSY
jgi:hypothetical protein